MKIRFLNGRFQGRTYDLKKGVFGIGRGAENDLVLDDDGISRAHCRILGDGTQFLIEDLGSTNGVRVNGKRTEGRVALKPGDNIGIGQYVILAADENDLVNPAALPVTEGAAAADTTPQTTAKPGVAAPPPPMTRNLVPGTAPAGKPFPFIRAFVLVVLVAVLGVVVYLTFFAHQMGPLTGTDGTAGDDKTGTPRGDSAALMPPAGSDGSDSSSGSDSASGSDGSASTSATSPESATPAGSSSASGSGSSSGSAATGTERPGGGDTTTASPAAVPANTSALRGSPVAVIESEPPGAEAKVNGTAVGRTPVVLRNLAPGRQMLTLNLKGYEELSRQINIPDSLPDKPLILKQKPGTLLVTSTPTGATVLQGSRILGQTPVVIDDLAPGEYDLAASMIGYEPKRFKATIAAIRNEKIAVDLKSRLGSFEAITFPAGCAVYVDDTFFGKTAPAADPLGDSKPLLVTNLLAGDHILRAKHVCGVDTRLRVTLLPGETKTVALRLWIADTEVVLKDGSKRVGMLTEKNAQGDIVIKESLKKSERLLKPDIQRITPLTLEQIRQIMEKVRPLDIKDKEPTGGTLPPTDGGAKSGGGEPATVSGMVGGDDEEEAPKARPAEKKTTKVQGMVGDE